LKSLAAIWALETIKADLAGPDGKPLKPDRTSHYPAEQWPRGKLNWSSHFKCNAEDVNKKLNIFLAEIL
jgi:hypothetical protein